MRRRQEENKKKRHNFARMYYAIETWNEFDVIAV